MAPQHPTAYVSAQCPNCIRFIKSAQRLGLTLKVVNIDTVAVQGLTAVPTVVDANKTMVGTEVFDWLQTFESNLPLEAYAMVMGQCTGLSYTDLETDDCVEPLPFTQF